MTHKLANWIDVALTVAFIAFTFFAHNPPWCLLVVLLVLVHIAASALHRIARRNELKEISA